MLHHNVIVMIIKKNYVWYVNWLSAIFDFEVEVQPEK